MAIFYTAVLERAADGRFRVFFPDVPGCASGGDTLEEAARNAEEALQSHADMLAEAGEPMTEPSELDRVGAEAGVKEAARLLVRVEPPRRAARVNVTLPDDLLAAVDRFAERRERTE